jgi:endonuclease/exonuclease/phosphatase family metal-dependent hydrolase
VTSADDDPPAPDRARVRLRVVSYNVRDLLDDRDAVAHVLRALRCDVACLQEVPRRWFQRRGVSRLARETGLRWACGGRASGGTAIFVGRRLDVDAAGAFRLPVRAPWTRTRGAAVVTVSLDGVRLAAASVHLPLGPDDRVTHARIVRARLAALAPGAAGPSPLVIAGDLNEPPGGPAWEVLGAGLTDVALDATEGGAPAPTFTARRPARRIDAVLVGPGVLATSVRVPGSPTDAGFPDVSVADLQSASDHLPVVVDLLLGAGLG